MRKLPKEEHIAPESAAGADRADIEECFNEAMALEAEGRNPYPGSTYVGGVKAALAWVLGESDDQPLEW